MMSLRILFLNLESVDKLKKKTLKPGMCEISNSRDETRSHFSRRDEILSQSRFLDIPIFLEIPRFLDILKFLQKEVTLMY
ncbi:hypothetical protein NQ318_017949 [Aromia moschata]|uniref:Maturase K n=1 Tax=Aromia moschata TaxID=1265417 RepID=A0AAV8Y5K6_9CUCU|nr:hypothetical protein NQ318_017949 [Aromia moschata]